MSTESKQFALTVTWSWPVVVVMFVFLALPVFGPLMPAIEGGVWPVTGKITFINQTPVQGGIAAQMSYTKDRDCQFLGVSADNLMSGEAVDFHPYLGDIPVGTWATGSHISRPWFIGAPNTDGLRVRWVHRCSLLWLTVTQAFP